MPKPQSKSEILSASQQERQQLDEFLAGLTSDQMIQTGIMAEWSVKDFLAHLYEWEQMVLGWLETSQRGETPHVPAEGYNWGQLPDLNKEIRLKHSDTPLDEIQKMYRESHGKIMSTIESMPEERMFTRGLYPWMNKNTLAAYFTSATSSHYRWARKEMRKGLKRKS